MRDLSALPDLNLALIQTSLAWHDRQANLDHFELLLEQAKGADHIGLDERTRAIESRLFDFANFLEARIALLYVHGENEVRTQNIIRKSLARFL